MVAQAGGYYGTAFGGERGVTQGDLLPPTIFNVVVDAIVRHWVHGVVGKTEARGETGREDRHQAALSYADDGMVASSDPAWIQGSFTALVGLFDRVGLRKISGRLSAWSANPARRRRETEQKRHTGGDSRERGIHTRSGSASGWNARSVKNSWRSGQCQVI